MIVQTAPEGQPRLVIYQIDHARMSGELAERFGNADFAPLDPRDEMVYIVAHHDEGWDVVDAEATRDPRTSLPQHLTQTRLPDLIRTGSRTPDFNERHHPFCGVISSMHTWGLYHGRYGLSDKIFIDAVPPESKPKVEAMLDAELARQERLRQALSAQSGWARLATQDALFRNYKLLQFFDTLSLYFHTVHPHARGEVRYLNVPMSETRDSTVTVKPVSIADGVYSVAPFPFDDALSVSYEGRFVMPAPDGTDFAAVMRETPPHRETITLLAG